MNAIRFSPFMLSTCWLALVTVPANAGQFVPLGDLTGGLFISRASAISADGTTIVGFGKATSQIARPFEAVRWVLPDLAIEPLRAPLIDDGLSRQAVAVSSDGRVVAGYTEELNPLITSQTFLWSEGNGFTPITMPPEIFSSHPTDISADGKVVVGEGLRPSYASEAFRWTSQGGMQFLGTLPTDPRQRASAIAQSVSADGDVVVGVASSGISSEAFRWTAATGMIGLGHLPGGSGLNSIAYGVSADGSTVVGFSNSEERQNTSEAFRWTAEGGMERLGFLDSAETASGALFASDDGEFVFGYSNRFGVDAGGQSTLNTRTFVWDEQSGMRNLVDLVRQESGLSAAFMGWSSVYATGASDDLRSFVGVGANPDGNTEAWYVRLDQPLGVPEPSALVILAGAAAAFSLRFRR
jgi:probable HAF family extracellular repeat protein